MQVSTLTNYLDAVLVSTHGAVGTQAKEQRARRITALDLKVAVKFQTRVSYVVINTEGEVILGAVFFNSSKTAFTIAGVNSFDERP